jgi:cytochrome c-type biogenesis protein CcmH/NrfG
MIAATPPHAAPQPRAQRVLALVATAVGALLPFWGALAAGFVNWDDDMLLLRHDRYQALTGEHLAWMFGESYMGHYQPLTWLSYAFDHALWGLDPFGFHLTNLLLHAANALAFWWLLRVLSAGAVSPWWAAFGALLFAVHPLRVESVAWVTERRTLVCGLFWLLAIGCWVQSRRATAHRARWGLALAAGCMFASLLANAWAMTLPVVLLLLDVWPLRRLQAGGSRWRLVLEKWPFVALAAVAGVAALAAQGAAGARVSWHDHDLVARCAQAAYGLCYYVRATLWPVALSPLHPLEHALDPGEARFVVSLVVVLAAAVAAWLWRRRAPALVVGAAIYLVVLLPVLGFVQSGPQLVAERYSYLPALVLPAALVLSPRVRGAGVRALPVALALLALLSWRTVQQTAVWRDSRTLWEHTLSLYPDSFHAHLHYAEVLAAEGNADGALAEYRRTVELQPLEHKGWQAIGGAEFRRGDFAASLDAYRRAHELQPHRPEHLHGMAIAALQLGRAEDCVRSCERCLAADPDWPHAWPVLGDALLRLGRRAEAQVAFERAVLSRPDDEHARQRLRELR